MNIAKRTQKSGIPRKLFSAEQSEALFLMARQYGLTQLLKVIEKQVLAAALVQADDNSTEAAAMLDLNRTTVVEMRRRHGFMINPKGTNGAIHGKKTEV